MDHPSQDNRSHKDLHFTTQKFISLLEAVASKSLGFVQPDEFIEVYKNVFKSFKPNDESVRPPLAGSSVEAKKIRDNLHQLVLTNVKEEISLVVNEENLDARFCELDEMKVELRHSNKHSKAWRPPGNAMKHIEPFTTAAKLEEKKRLILMVKSEREKFNILKARNQSTRKRVLMLDDKVRHNMSEITKSGSCSV